MFMTHNQVVVGSSLAPMIQYIWVLGATGYVGKHVVLELLDRFQGDPMVQIVAVGNQSIDVEVMERTHFLMMPLGEIGPKWLERYPPSILFHCARMAGSSSSARNRAAKLGEKSNRKLKIALESLPKPPIVVYCSGTLMYGNSTKPIFEDTAENPIAYARAYERAERPWKEGSKKLDIRIAYPAWIFGKGSWFEAFYAKPGIIDGTTHIIDDGNAVMNLVHVEDVAGQLVHIATHGLPSERYNIYGNSEITQGQFAAYVAQCLRSEIITLPEAALVKRFGRTVTEALTSSIVLGTKHQDWKDSYTLKRPDWETMVDEICAAYLRKS